MAEEILFTLEGYEAKQAELEELTTVKRPEIAQRLRDAIAFGDLSENAEYDSAKNEQAELEDRIGKLEALLRNARIVQKDDGERGVVRIGSKVKIRNTRTKKESEYLIVTSSEADPVKGKLSSTSPVGAALMDKKAKTKVDVQLPSGKARYEIVSVRMTK
jgi:transcription elongation factor GreA